MSKLPSSDELKEKLLKIVEWHTFYIKDHVNEIKSEPVDSPRLKEHAETTTINSIVKLIAERERLAVENARANDPLKCEYGHEVFSHKTIDGWCCACEADQAFLEDEIRLARFDEIGAVQSQHGNYLTQTFINGEAMTVVERYEQLSNHSQEEK